MRSASNRSATTNDLREMKNSESSRAASLRPLGQGGRGHGVERSSVTFQNELRTRQGQPLGNSDGKVGEAAQISVDWDPIVENTTMSCYKGSNGGACVFDTFETQVRFAARVLACKRMVCAGQPNTAAIEVIHMPLSNANTSRATMLHDGTSLLLRMLNSKPRFRTCGTTRPSRTHAFGILSICLRTGVNSATDSRISPIQCHAVEFEG
jgi:hypothetical protein